MKSIDAHAALLALVARSGSQKAAAETIGVSLPYLNDLIHQRRRISDRILQALGLARVVVKKSVKESRDAC